MNADEAQHQDELVRQERLLRILEIAYTGNGYLFDDDWILLASALGLSKEFKQTIGLGE